MRSQLDYCLFFLLFSTILSGVAGCFKNVGPDGTPVPPAACDECHDFPGSAYCKSTVTMVGGKTTMQCSFCHAGSIKPDSTISPLGKMWYHDRMVSINGRPFPHTDSLHADGSTDIMFQQCMMCHGFPPDTGKHDFHVRSNGKQCYECHFLSVQCSTIVEAPYNGGGGNETVRFIQKMRATVFGDSVPLHNPEGHLDKMTTVAFRNRKADSINNPGGFVDTFRVWNGADNSCFYMQTNGCHLSNNVRLWKK